jgi:hypothetical protein
MVGTLFDPSLAFHMGCIMGVQISFGSTLAHQQTNRSNAQLLSDRLIPWMMHRRKSDECTIAAAEDPSHVGNLNVDMNLMIHTLLQNDRMSMEAGLGCGELNQHVTTRGQYSRMALRLHVGGLVRCPAA